MIGRYLLAAVVAGLLAGALLTALQMWRLSPLIAAAEVYEKTQPCVESMPGMKMCDEAAHEWSPAPGLPRFAATGAASLLSGAGFSLMLAGIALLLNVPITKSNGWIWGACGFACVHLATSFGLPPQLPGMAEADLVARQVWWIGCIFATGGAVYCFALRRELWAWALGLLLLLAPNAIGAPQAAEAASQVPPALAARFAANALVAAAVFWLVMGVALGFFLPKMTESFET